MMNSFPLLTGSVHENGIAQINDYDDRYDELGSEYNEVNNEILFANSTFCCAMGGGCPGRH